MTKRTKYLLLFVIILCLVSVVTYSYSYAKYVSNHAWNYYLSTKGFYFSSNELGINKITNVNNNWNYDRTYFTIKNSEGKMLTDYDIEYTVKCSIQNDVAKNSKCLLNGTNSDTFNGVISSGVCVDNASEIDVSTYSKSECDEKGYEWKIEEKSKELYFDIVKTSEEELNYVNVLIEVSSTSPYSKTLLGEFNLSSSEMQVNSLNFSYKEFENYSRVVVTNPYDEGKCVKLNWNSENLRIDNLNEQISKYEYDGNGYINGINFNINKKDSVSYIFYKTDENVDINLQEFSLIESNDC